MEIPAKSRPEKTIVCASLYADPITVGHIDYLKRAKALGDVLIVIVNTDDQALLKKGFSFMCENERIEIIRSLKFVDSAILSIDTDRTVCETLAMIKPDIFAKGGDTSLAKGNIPEKKVCDELGIKLVDGLGDKIQSSRWLLREVKKNLDRVGDEYLNAEM